VKIVLACAALITLSVLPGAVAQQSAPVHSAHPSGLRQTSPAPPAQNLYQPHDTWYEFLLKQFNPQDLDYGQWIEERRRAFLDAYVHNPHFVFSLATVLLLVLSLAVNAKQRIDYRSTQWVTAEMMTDLYNHDIYSQQVADEAIRRYNDHIERCNRAVEAAEHNGAVAEGDSAEADGLRAKVLQQAGEMQLRDNTIAQLEQTLRRKEDLIVELSVRMDALAARTNNKDVAAQPVDLRGSDTKLMQLVNNLQEQVYVAEEKNKRLKGA